MKQYFDRWVSIGGSCMSKYQINRYIARRFFDLEENSASKAHYVIAAHPKKDLHAINGGNLFFDWVYVGDYMKVCDMLESGFHYELSEDHLERRVSDDAATKAMICHRSGIHWMHLFSEQNDLQDWREQIPGLQPKLDHTRSQFLALNDYSTLYVLAAYPGFENSGLPEKLYDAIAGLRSGSEHAFRLLVCTPDALPRDQGGISVRPFAIGGGAPWFGDAESWDIAFDDFALTAERNLVDVKTDL